MSDGGSYARTSAIVECHHATVAQWQLNFALCLLASHLTRYRTVCFVGEPIFTSHGFELQNAFNVRRKCFFAQLVFIGLAAYWFVFNVLIVAFNGVVYHYCLGRMAKHLRHIKVERLSAVGLFEGEVGITRSLAHHIKRCPFALGNLPYAFDVLFVDKQAHTFLALVGDNLFGRECFVANGQLVHVNFSATFFHKFTKAIQVSCRTVVVY